MNTLCIRTLAAALISAAAVTPCLAQVAATAPVERRGSGPRQTTIPISPGPDAPRGPELRGISVVLVEGDLVSVTANSSLPAAAAKALADMKDFLPYKGYRVLDTQWTLGSGRIAVRLRGPNGQEYDLELTSSYSDGAARARMDALFARGLTSAATAGGAQTAGVSVTEFKLREASPLGASLRAFQGQPQGGRNQGEPAARGPVAAFAGGLGSAALIETAFRMDVGETVVVGTSRLQGDKALIVLLTAVAK